MFKRKKKKERGATPYLSVTELAYFSAKPYVFSKKKGKAWNQASAINGQLSHREDFRAFSINFVRLVIFLCSTVLAVTTYLYLH